MDKLFSLNELNKKAEKIREQNKDRTEIARVKFVNKHYSRIDNLKTLMGEFPDRGHAYFLWTLNSFNAFTFIVYVIKHCGRIEDLTLSTYSINDRILTSLVKWYDKGEIGSVNISISDSIRHRMPRVYDQLQAQSATRNMQVHCVWNHSKVTLMKTADHHFVVEGSGNFSENAQNEQYLFLNDPEVYNFRRSCILPQSP